MAHNRYRYVTTIIDLAENALDFRLSKFVQAKDYLGTYKVYDKGLLGRGGQGSVFDIERTNPHTPTPLPLVFKVTKNKLTEERSREAEDLRAEFEVYEHLGQHRNIVRAIAFIGQVGLTGMLIEKGATSLKDLRDSNNFNLSDADVGRIVLDVARGLKHLHQQHWYHNDVKAANIILFINDDGSRTAKLADFGLAAPDTYHPTSGTLSALPPEALRRHQLFRVLHSQLVSDLVNSKLISGADAQRIAHQAIGRDFILSMREHVELPSAQGLKDVWGLGVVLFYLLFGKTPTDSSYINVPPELQASELSILASDLESPNASWKFKEAALLAESPFAEALRRTLTRESTRCTLDEAIGILEQVLRSVDGRGGPPLAAGNLPLRPLSNASPSHSLAAGFSEDVPRTFAPPSNSAQSSTSSGSPGSSTPVVDHVRRRSFEQTVATTPTPTAASAAAAAGRVLRSRQPVAGSVRKV